MWYKIGSQRFRCKDDIREYFKDLLKYGPLNSPAPKDIHNELYDLLKMHPDFLDKNGCGVSYFTIQQINSNARCFFAHRADGTCVEFSYKKCLLSKKEDVTYDDKAKAVEALRIAIRQQINDFKNSLEIHHYGKPFSEIAEEFMRLYKVEIRPCIIGGAEMADDGIKALWQEFHKANAQLIALTKEQHNELHTQEAIN